MKRPCLAVAFVFALATATNALADQPSPALTATPGPAASAPTFADVRPVNATPNPKHSKRRASLPALVPATLLPLSFQQQQDAARAEFEAIFHVDHSG